MKFAENAITEAIHYAQSQADLTGEKHIVYCRPGELGLLVAPWHMRNECTILETCSPVIYGR